MSLKKHFFACTKKLKNKYFTRTKNELIILVGMGRSGTTWAGDIINYEHNSKILFEPFFPAKVREAEGFEYIQYLNPSSKNGSLATQALQILSGNIKPNKWTDRDTFKATNNSLIIKDIRCNLMVGWLQKIAKYPPTILLIRHPLQIVSSWKRLGWGNEVLGRRSDLDIIVSQRSLLKDFPIINIVLEKIDKNDYVENIVFIWCVFHLVPLTHLKTRKTYFLFYENLINDYTNEVIMLFKYLNKPFNLNKLQEVAITSSSTNFNNRNFKNNKSFLVNSWKTEFSKKQIQRATYIINAFKLNYLYDDEGNPTNPINWNDK